MGLTPSATPTVGVAAGRIARRPFVIGLLGAVALICAACGGGGPQHLGAKAADRQTVTRANTTSTSTTTTQPSPSTTTTTAPAVKTNASTFAPAPGPAPATTTTTDPLPPACAWSDFVARASTDQASYAPGQTVQISLSFANTGPACTVNATGYACPVVNIDDAAGALVWSSAASPSAGCPSSSTGPTVLAANWSEGFSFAWQQTSCTPGQAACTGPPVPAGSYQVIGKDSGGSSQIPAASPVSVTLTAASS